MPLRFLLLFVIFFFFSRYRYLPISAARCPDVIADIAVVQERAR